MDGSWEEQAVIADLKRHRRDNVKGKEILPRASPGSARDRKIAKKQKEIKKEDCQEIVSRPTFTNFFQFAPSSAPQRSHPVPNISFSLNVTFLSEKALSGDEATKIMSKNVTVRTTSLLTKLQHIPMNINHDKGTTPKTDIFFCPSNSGPIKFFVLLKWPILPRKTSISETGVIELMRGRRLSVV